MEEEISLLNLLDYSLSNACSLSLISFPNEVTIISVLPKWQIDGKKNNFYGQNLCYMAKLSLNHRTV
jgi:hypothetical protein